jgi:hypothetical protein
MVATEPELSVVVASVSGWPYLAACLEALERQGEDIEVLVADAAGFATPTRVAERFPRVRLLSFHSPMTVPQLRAAGIFAARAPYVAVIEDHCNVRGGWAQRLLAAHREGHPVVGGAVCNAAAPTIRNWAAFLAEYSSCMPPLPGGVVEGVPGMNVSYDRDAIAAMADLLREGRWEGWLHARLIDSGFELWSEPDAALDHMKNFSFRELFAQGYHFSRTYAGMRNDDVGRQRWLRALASPLLVPLMYRRVRRNVTRTGAHQREFARAKPLILLYLAVWAAGEAAGGLFGAGRSPLRVR